MPQFAVADILVLNWRGDGLPREANKIRPCVVVEDGGLFSDEHPTVIVVPLTTKGSAVISQLSVRIAPTSDNGLTQLSFAPAYMVTAASKARIDGQPLGQVTPAQLASIRAFIAECMNIF